MNMYVGNLSYNVKESDLRQVMEEYGVVESVKLITDRETRRSKGFAFVEMPESSEASNAIKELNGAEYAGRPMVVKEALPRSGSSGVPSSLREDGLPRLIIAIG